MRLLCTCRLRLTKLADRGARIQLLYDRITKEIDSRNEMDEAAAFFSDLNIAEKGLKTVTQMEWNGGKANASGEQLTGVDSDDDAEEERNVDPLKVIAQSRAQTKIVKVEKAVPSLITAADLQEIKSFGVELDPHALYVCDIDKLIDEKRKKFLPHKTTKSDVHSVAKEKGRLHGKHWEVTAATPPMLRNSEAKVLTLKESIEIERKYKDDLKQLQETQATERLESRKKLISENIGLLPVGTDFSDPNKLFETYREKGTHDDDSEDEAVSENSDDGEEPEAGGVSVVVYD